MKQLETQGHKCYEVSMGGASLVDSVGFIEDFMEFAEQVADMGIHPDCIFRGTGTGGTMVELAASRVLTGPDIEIISINVSWKDEDYPKRTQDLANESLALLGTLVSVEASRDIHTDLSYYLPGCEIPDENATEAIRLLAQTGDLFIDPVYTGKAFVGMLDHIRVGRVPRDNTVVFWHTGGATASFTGEEILGEIL